MNNSYYKRVLFFIAGVIVVSLFIQVYWNYKNYQNGKQQLINDVQTSLDNAVEEYYASSAKKNSTSLFTDSMRTPVKGKRFTTDFIRKTMDSSGASVNGLILGKDSGLLKKQQVFKLTEADFPSYKLGTDSLGRIKILPIDSAEKIMGEMVSRVMISLKQDSLDLNKMDSLIQSQLNRKNLDIEYDLLFTRENKEQYVMSDLRDKNVLSAQSESAWLPDNSLLTLNFTNVAATILKNNTIGIVLSGVLMASVIGCLLFLLNIIKRQKELAEIKNDLISNITHEFKTPIATIKVALEGILNFNKQNDPEKTSNYVKASNEQIDKLDDMVEKLLETATLSGNQLQLYKEEITLNDLIQTLILKHQSLAPDKSFIFNSNTDNLLIKADPFHLENAFNNILDNAVKYGGDKISVLLKSEMDIVKLQITDNGNSLTRQEAKQIFEKFYRVPKGNTHNIKGFGIGLFYTRQIIERHGGNIEVEVNKETSFYIFLPYE